MPPGDADKPLKLRRARKTKNEQIAELRERLERLESTTNAIESQDKMTRAVGGLVVGVIGAIFATPKKEP